MIVRKASGGEVVARRKYKVSQVDSCVHECCAKQSNVSSEDVVVPEDSSLVSEVVELMMSEAYAKSIVLDA